MILPYLLSYLVKNTAGAHKEPSKKYKSNLRTLKSKLQAMRTKNEDCTSIIMKHLSHCLLTAELQDSADVIKVLNMSKTTRAFTSSAEVQLVVRVCSMTEIGISDLN